MRVGEIIRMDPPIADHPNNIERVVEIPLSRLLNGIHRRNPPNDVDAARALMHRQFTGLLTVLWLYRRKQNIYECCVQYRNAEPTAPQPPTLTGADIRRFANGQMFINDMHVGEIRDLTIQPSDDVDEYRRRLADAYLRNENNVRPNTPNTRRMQVSYEIANLAHQALFGTVLDSSEEDLTRRALEIAIQSVDRSITQILRYQVYPEDLTFMVIYEVPEEAPPLRDVSAIPAGFIYAPYIPNLTTALPESTNPDPEPNALPDAPVVITKDPRPKTIEDFIETPRRRRERSDIMD